MARALGVEPERPYEPQAEFPSPASSATNPEPAKAGESVSEPGSKPNPADPGQAKGSDTAPVEAKTAAAEVLARYGLKPPEGDKAGATAGNEQPGNKGALQAATPENIERFINPDGKQPADVQLVNSKKLIVDAQSHIGKLGTEVKVLRDFAESTRDWFRPTADGTRQQPYLPKIAENLDDATLVQQLQEAAPQLKALGFELKPIDGAPDDGTLAQQIAKELIPGEMTHEERMEQIDANPKLAARLEAKMEVAKSQAGERARNARATATVQTQAQQAELERVLKGQVDEIAKAAGSKTWTKLQPLLQKHGQQLVGVDPRVGLKYAHAAAMLDLVPEMMEEASSASYQAGYQAGLKGSGMVLPSPGAGNGAPPSQAADGSPLATPAQLRYLGLD